MKTATLMAILYAILVLALSTIPGSRMPHIDLLSMDKLLHLGEYFIMAVLTANALRWRIDSAWRLFGFTLMVAILFGAGDELYQTLIPGRDSSPYDWGADVIGATIGTTVFILWNGRHAEKTPH